MPTDNDETAQRATTCIMCDMVEGAPDKRAAFCGGVAVAIAMGNALRSMLVCEACGADVVQALAHVEGAGVEVAPRPSGAVH